MRAYKLVTLGSSGVGKSSIMLRYVRNTFSDTAVSTIGASFLVKSIALPDGHRFRLELWDTAGQERYASLAPMYYRSAQAALIVYDVTDRPTWERAQEWVRTLKVSERSDIIMILVGNKTDLPDRAVSLKEAGTFAREQDIMHVEVSAKLGAGIDAIFSSVTNILVAASKSRSKQRGAAAHETGAEGGENWFETAEVNASVANETLIRLHRQRMQSAGSTCTKC